MSRNSKTFLNKQNLFIFGAVALAVAIGAVFLRPNGTHQFSKLAAFPVENYLENNGLMSQEDFLIDGTVENVLLRDGTGRRLLVAVQTEKNGLLLPVLLQSNEKPIQRGQRLLMAVHIGAEDDIVCTNYEIR